MYQPGSPDGAYFLKSFEFLARIHLLKSPWKVFGKEEAASGR